MTLPTLTDLRNPRLAAALVLAASVVILGSVFASQYLGGLAPCKLCIWQRWPYGAAILLAAAALPAAVPAGARRLLLALAGVAFMVTAGIGFYHAGVEYKVFTGPSACSGSASATTLEALRAQLMAAPIVRCDEVPWSLFGISMAGYNFLVASALAAYALGVAAGVRLRGSRP
jgi:disulfide bond formation protein DsbB